MDPPRVRSLGRDSCSLPTADRNRGEYRELDIQIAVYNGGFPSRVRAKSSVYIGLPSRNGDVADGSDSNINSQSWCKETTDLRVTRS